MAPMSFHRSELARQEAASSQASAEAARAARKAEVEATRTAFLRRVVEAEERVRAYEIAAIERARHFDAAQQASREEIKVQKRVADLELALEEARQEQQQWATAAMIHTDAYNESRTRWNDSKGAQQEWQDAKNALDDLMLGYTSAHGLAESRKVDHQWSSASTTAKGGTMDQADTVPVDSVNELLSAPAPSLRSSHAHREMTNSKPARSSPSILQAPPSPASKLDGSPRRRTNGTTVIPVAELARKQRVSQGAEVAAKRARLSGIVKIEDEDPF